MAEKNSPQFYRFGNYLQEGLHLGVLAAFAVGAGEWAGLHSLMLGAAGAGVLTVGGGKLLERFLPRMFTERSPSNKRAFGLVKPVKILSQKLGMEDQPTVYNFELNPEFLKKDDPTSANPHARRILNAAAAGFAKPALIISDHLLELLKPGEKQAVLAHEFAHLGAKHTRLGMATSFLHMTTMFTAALGFGQAVLEQGWKMAGLTIVGSVAINHYGDKYLPKQDQRYTRDGELKPRAKWIAVGTQAAQELFALGLMAIPNPAVILTAAAIEHGFFWGSGLVTKSYSRRHEFQADRGAVALGANPLALVTSLRKLEESIRRDEPAFAASRDWRSGSLIERGGKLACSVYKSHPDTTRRCQRLARLAAARGQNVEAITAAMMAKVDISALPPLTNDPGFRHPSVNVHDDHARVPHYAFVSKARSGSRPTVPQVC